MAALFSDYLAEAPDHFEPELREIIQSGLALDGMDVARDYLLVRGGLVDQVNDVFKNVDYMLTPSMPLTAWKIGERPSLIGGSALPAGGTLARAYTLFPFNLTGHPAISVPVGKDHQELPIGVQIVGRIGDDAGVLKLAHQLEQLLA
jgi:Asp-tRNA(Asn)/Glu-tRNA(Gln) amidotransferase A subunit family amidase